MSTTPIGGDSIRQSPAGQPWRVILAVACAALILGATAARAEPPTVTRTVNDDQDAPFADTDPCIGGDLVAGTGHLHTVFIDRSRGTTVDTTYRFQHNGEAANVTDPSDLKDYRFKSSGDTDLKSSTKNFSFTMRTREHIIREGHEHPWQPKDDYFVSSSVKITGLAPKPVITREHSETSCK